MLVFAGFVAAVALVLAVVMSSIALYRRTRQRQQRNLSSTVVDGRKRVNTVATGNRRPIPASRDVIRLTAIEGVQKASSCNTIREPSKTDAQNV